LQEMLGSIFPGRLIFQDGNDRTEGMNSALSLIPQKTNGLQKQKTGNAFTSENISGDVPSPGAFSNQFIEGMKKLYELQSFLDIRLLRQGEEPSRVREELLALTGT
jgi:hypothetical protein